jgi:hypothetical protein
MVDLVNDAPIIDEIASQEMDEDTALDITLSASDVDDGTGEGDENDLSFSAESDNSFISVSVSGEILTVVPDEDYYGSGTITVTVTDLGNRLTDETSFLMTVTNINDAPLLTEIGSQATDEEVTVSREINFSDVDSNDPFDTHTITVESSSPSDVSVENISGDISGSTYDLVPSTDFHGDVTITVTVTDSGTESLSDSEVYILTVSPVNDAPVMAVISDTSTVEEASLTMTVSSSDVDTGTGDGDENIPSIVTATSPGLELSALYEGIFSSPSPVPVSTSLEDTVMVKDASSTVLVSEITAITGASFTGLTVNI